MVRRASCCDSILTVTAKFLLQIYYSFSSVTIFESLLLTTFTGHDCGFTLCIFGRYFNASHEFFTHFCTMFDLGLLFGPCPFLTLESIHSSSEPSSLCFFVLLLFGELDGGLFLRRRCGDFFPMMVFDGGFVENER